MRSALDPDVTSDLSMGVMYRAHEFAKQTGVTVRTLHHYDRLGLLKPSARSESGYRLYGERDFARLEQIVALKFVGLSLGEIRKLLSGKAVDLVTALRIQRNAIAAKRRRLDQALAAIEKAERMLAGLNGGAPDWSAFAKIIEVINMQDTEWTKKYYSEEARAAIATRQVPQHVIEQGQRDWAELIPKVEDAVARGVTPDSAEAQALAARWSELLRQFTGGNPEVQKGLNKLYSDEGNWPTTFKKPFSDAAGALMCEAIKLAKR